MTTVRDTPPNASGVLELLRRHYLPDPTRPGGIFAPEIAAPGPLRRRADLIWQGCTAASGHELIGHEIKVTRADLLAELTDPAKSDPWQACCDRWYLVVPDPALLDGIDLPVTWGVLTPPSGRRTRSMTRYIPAPKLTPTDQAAGLRVLATWLHWRHDRCTRELDSARADNKRLRARVDELRRATGPDVGSLAQQSEQQVVTEIVRQLGGADGTTVGGRWKAEQVSVEDTVAALRNLGTVYDRAQRVQWAANTVVGTLHTAVRGIDPDKVAALDNAVAALRDVANRRAQS